MISLLIEILRIIAPNILLDLFKPKKNAMDEVNQIIAEVDAKYKKVKDEKDPSDVADFINRIK